MKKTDDYSTNDYIIEWYVSLFFFFAGTALFVYGMFRTGGLIWLSSFIMFVLFVRFYLPSKKHLMCADGYTIIEAMHFYKQCRKLGAEKKYDSEICLAVAAKFDYSMKLSPSQVKNLFFIGEEYVNRRREK